MTSQTQAEPIIKIDQVSKTYPGDVQAVKNVSLEVHQGEFFALLGPSGCGKTTLLRMLAGFEIPNEGSIMIDGEDMTDVQPNARCVNMVFQSYAVFPHMTVFDNVGYGLKVDGVKKKEIQERVKEALELVRLGDLGARMPNELSGGQRQRVALARALVKRPKVLLLDEPLSALDAKLREAMQMELVRLQKTVGITFIIVTHDQSEALSMADRIAVMEGGTVRQIATPEELYEDPNSRFVADFIGQINLFDGTAIASQTEEKVHATVEPFGTMEIWGETLGPVSLAIRPEKINIDIEKPTISDHPMAQGTVTDIAYYGGYSNVFVDVAGTRIMAEVSNDTRIRSSTFEQGTKVWISFNADDALALGD